LGSGDVATTEIDPYIHAGKSIVEIGWNKGLTIVVYSEKRISSDSLAARLSKNTFLKRRKA
jgi:hypothetical protein